MFRYAIAALTALSLSACQPTTSSPKETAAFIEAGIETQEFFADSIEGILTRCERYFRTGTIPSAGQLAREGYRPVDDPSLEVQVYAKPPPGSNEISVLTSPSVAFTTNPTLNSRNCTMLTPPVADHRWLQVFLIKHFEDRGYVVQPRRNERSDLVMKKGSRYIGFNGGRDRRGVALTVMTSLSARDVERLVAGLQ